jgi:hypothetical protein
MKALGSITGCFPLVDSETRDILEQTMKDALDFDSFGEDLCKRVYGESVPVLARYFAYYFAFVQTNMNLINRLVESGVDSAIAEPLVLMIRAGQGEEVAWDTHRRALFKSLEATDSDWIAS